MSDSLMSSQLIFSEYFIDFNSIKIRLTAGGSSPILVKDITCKVLKEICCPYENRDDCFAFICLRGLIEPRRHLVDIRSEANVSLGRQFEILPGKTEYKEFDFVMKRCTLYSVVIEVPWVSLFDESLTERMVISKRYQFIKNSLDEGDECLGTYLMSDEYNKFWRGDPTEQQVQTIIEGITKFPKVTWSGSRRKKSR